MLSDNEGKLLKQTWFLVAAALLTLAAFLFYFAATITLDKQYEYIRAILNSMAGAATAVALIDVFHEYFVARDVRNQFKILSDFKQNGVERVGALAGMSSFTPQTGNIRRVVFTGSCGGGKTKVLARLRDQGFITVPEPTDVFYTRRFGGDRQAGEGLGPAKPAREGRSALRDTPRT